MRDARFFAANPDRRYRFRLATANDLREAPVHLPEGFEWCTAVFLADDGDLHCIVMASLHFDGAEVSEAVAQAIFNRAADQREIATHNQYAC
jgi:hypothetical protein